MDLHDIYREYSTLTFNFDNTTVNTTEANQGANPLALAAARHQSIDYTAFLQVSTCPLPVARLHGSYKGRMQRVGPLVGNIRNNSPDCVKVFNERNGIGKFFTYAFCRAHECQRAAAIAM